MAITAADVAKLRSLTGAGMMDSKKALEEANGDMEMAADLLRKKGIVKAAKRADKVAAEGMVATAVKGNVAALVEVNSETDFVAKNDDFKQLVETLAKHVVEKKPADIVGMLGQELHDATESVETFVTNATLKIGEKISLRRFTVMEKTDSDAFGAYIHAGGKIGVLVLLRGSTSEDLARDVALHIAASNPKCIDRSGVAADLVEREKSIYVEQLRTQGKPEAMIENITKGKLEKFYAEICLLEQPFIKDEDKTVAAYVQSIAPGATVASFVRFELGEGIEKQTTDFVAEVTSQLK